MSQVLSYRGYAAECTKLAREAYSADGRRILVKMAADWLTLADMAAKREGEPQVAEMSCYPVPSEITSISADFLVVDAVLRNRSPACEFPANRENNREYFNFWLFRLKSTCGTVCVFSWLRGNSLGNGTGNKFSANRESFRWNREF
jgi:hypothetical protein